MPTSELTASASDYPFSDRGASADPVSVHLVTLGCARNEVDSEELAGRLAEGGFRLVDEAEQADAVMVNTCGFVEAAKKDSVDTLLSAAELKSGKPQAVVAVGCLAERYGNELAESLPEADAVLGFDDYADIAERLQSILAGERHQSHVPRDRRRLLPIAPSERPRAATSVAIPGHATDRSRSTDQARSTDQLLPSGLAPASGPRTFRRRLDGGPSAPLKIASGCDRRCTFCAIPAFRGAYISRPPAEVVAEARWLAEQGVREVFLVSENSSSYGKDLGDIRALEGLLADLSQVDGVDWIRVSYLQPAEMRPSLIEAMATTPKVVSYFDLSFQHAAPDVLARMRRFGNPESFLGLISTIRDLAPTAGIRSNVIVGFPGETEDDLQTLTDFLIAAELDAVGVFGYSDEDGTGAARLDGQHQVDVIEQRRDHLATLIDELVNQRAEARIGERVQVLVEEVDEEIVGRAAHQGPEVDGSVTVLADPSAFARGDLLWGEVCDSVGADLSVTPVGLEMTDR